MAYKVKYRNKMYGYNKFFILDKQFKTKQEAKDFIKYNKEPYIDKIKIYEEKNNGI